ncbi:NUMOD3 domain-containing DNA-binding protein [Flavobacterium sp. GNP002]
MAYVYRHIRLDKKEPFYIGIGKDKYYNRAKSKAKRNNLWNKIVSKTDYDIEIIFEHDDYEIVKEKEKEFINLYGRKDLNKGSLSNLTDGGEGALGHIPSLEKRLNQSIKQKGVKRPDHGLKLKGRKKPNMVGVFSGANNPMFGKKHTLEAREIISKKKKNKLLQEDNPMWGQKRPELSESNKLLKSKKVLDTSTGLIYSSTREAADYFGINYSTLKNKLNNISINNTTLIRYNE